MGKKRGQRYQEGTWFAVPLSNGGFAVGVVARTDGRGIVFGYFFGPQTAEPVALKETENLGPERAIWKAQFGDLGLIKGAWPIIGLDENWTRAKWPLVEFYRTDSISGAVTKVTYSDSLSEVSKTPVAAQEATGRCRDSLSGSGSIEYVLSDLLGPSVGYS